MLRMIIMFIVLSILPVYNGWGNSASEPNLLQDAITVGSSFYGKVNHIEAKVETDNYTTRCMTAI